MDSFILCGMQFGDEGKGTFVDYLAHEKNIDCIVRYNGGSQASHTVITEEGIKHKFSQLGSGMFLEKCHTYITENMVINLDNLLVEMEVFSNITGISIPSLIERIHIHENCFIVTPYHKLINKLREFSKGTNRRGTVGTGVSEVMYLVNESKLCMSKPTLGLQVKDIFNTNADKPIIHKLEELQNYVQQFYDNNKDVIWKNVPEEMKKDLEKEINFLLEPNAFLKISERYIAKFQDVPGDIDLSKCIYNIYETTLRKNCKSAIFEGSQGLLIDGIYGIKPNTTFLDTTNNFALDISYYRDNIKKIGIAKAFTSRHGLGVFPTESTSVASKISDENQEETFWNGKIRFGWFDAILFRYAQSINNVDEIYLSSLDKLSSFETIKICNEYVYNGSVDETFKQIFNYYIANEKVIITDIKQSSEDLGKYLKQCTPEYIKVNGWKKSLSNIYSKSELPIECKGYIFLIEMLINVPITIISVGPTRANKIRLVKKDVTQNEYS